MILQRLEQEGVINFIGKARSALSDRHFSSHLLA